MFTNLEDEMEETSIKSYARYVDPDYVPPGPLKPKTLPEQLLFGDEIAAVKRLFTRLRDRSTRGKAIGTIFASLVLVVGAIVGVLLLGALWIVWLCALGIFVAIGWGLRY